MNKKSLLITLVIFVFCFLIFYLFPAFLLTLELRIHDSFINTSKNLNKPSPHLKDIVIVALDDLSFWKIQKQWPYSRAIYAELLNKIYKGSPRIVLFDVVFRGEGEDKKGDELLIEALKDKNNVLLPYHFGKLGEFIKSKDDFIANSGSAGYINKPIDVDGAIRKLLPLRLTVEGKIKDYAVELYLFGKYYNYDLKNISLKEKIVYLNRLKTEEKDMFRKLKFSLLKDNDMWLNYQARTDDFNIISMFRILSEEIDPTIFKDKIVLIGATSEIFHDTHRSPFGLLPGVTVLANAALMFLDGRFIYDTCEWFRWLVIFLFCLVVVFFCYRISMIKGLLFIISIITIVIVATFLLFMKGYYFNPFKLILIGLISYITVNFYKYASLVIENMSLRKLSTVDELTGLYIFRFFKIVSNHEFQKSLRYKTSLAMLMVDIDNFKKINDTYGHQKGNVVLSKIGKIILKNMRKADFPARYGGEEIAILLPNSNSEGARKCAEILRKLIEQEDFFMTKSGPLKVTVSIGVSFFPSMHITSAEEMIKCADTALYKAKREGKNRTIVFSESA